MFHKDIYEIVLEVLVVGGAVRAGFDCMCLVCLETKGETKIPSMDC